jgi:hypothetical protein
VDIDIPDLLERVRCKNCKMRNAQVLVAAMLEFRLRGCTIVCSGTFPVDKVIHFSCEMCGSTEYEFCD